MDQVKYHITRATELTAISVSRLIKEKGFKANGRFIRFFCKLRMHTWGEVNEDVPKTEIGKSFQEIYNLKFGERKSLCCGKMQAVDAVLDSKHGGSLDEKYYKLRENCLR